MTIHQPASFWSRLPAHFAIGAGAVVAAAIVIGAVAVRETTGSRDDSQPGSGGAITQSDDRTRVNESSLERDLGDPLAVPDRAALNAAENRIRTAEAALAGAVIDIFAVPPERVLTLPANPAGLPQVIVGPL